MENQTTNSNTGNTELSIPVDTSLPKKKKKTYRSIKQAAEHTQIPYKHFQVADSLGAPGIYHNRIIWDEFGPWYERNKADVEKGLVTDKEQLEIYSTIREIIKKDLDIDKKRREALSPEEVSVFLTSLGTSQTSMIKSWIKEYPSKLAGRSEIECTVILQTAVNQLLEMYQKEIKSWMKRS